MLNTFKSQDSSCPYFAWFTAASALSFCILAIEGLPFNLFNQASRFGKSLNIDRIASKLAQDPKPRQKGRVRITELSTYQPLAAP